MVPNPEKFPDGISGLADKIHEMGLKIGLYSDSGLYTCAAFPGSLGYETLDAETFVEWKVDCKFFSNLYSWLTWINQT
jgi:alpha-galactosidase